MGQWEKIEAYATCHVPTRGTRGRCLYPHPTCALNEAEKPVGCLRAIGHIEKRLRATGDSGEVVIERSGDDVIRGRLGEFTVTVEKGVVSDSDSRPDITAS